ncbi:hypothetical protein CSUI_006951, partial [Cystoisospora suis]
MLYIGGLLQVARDRPNQGQSPATAIATQQGEKRRADRHFSRHRGYVRAAAFSLVLEKDDGRKGELNRRGRSR